MGIDPISLALITTAASGALGAGTSIMQGNYQSEVANMNARVAKDNAMRASAVSQIEAQESDLQTKALLGEQITSQTASGVSLSGRSQLLTRNTARMLGRRDAENIIAAGSAERSNFLTQRNQFKAEGKMAKLSGYVGAAGAVLDAASGMTGIKANAAKPPTSLVGSATSVARPIPKPVTLNPLTRRRPMLSYGGPR